MKLALQIAWRFLKESKKQTILIIIGIAVGVTVQIFIGLLITGLQKSLIESTVGNSSQITIVSRQTGGYIFNYEEVMKKLEDNDEVKNVSYVLETSSFANLGGLQISAFLRGFNFEKAEGIYGFGEKLIDGSLPKSENEILIGKELAEKYGLKTNDEFQIAVPPLVFLNRDLIISGIFDLKNATLNGSWIISDIETVRKITGKSGAVSKIEMQVDEVFEAKKISKELNIDDTEVIVENWEDQNEELLSALNGQTISSLLIQIFIIASLAITISSILAISVMNKYRQVGILKAMGLDGKRAFQIFLFQGLILGLIGSILGVLLGTGLLFSFTVFVTNPDGSPVISIYFDPAFLIFSIIIATSSASIASVIPSRKASKLDPVEVIKNG
jgi:lipoprotein-releasing system permease protein